MSNPEVSMTLTEAVGEVLLRLTGLTLSYDPTFDRFRAITACLNRALRENALDSEWSYYADVRSVGLAQAGVREVPLGSSLRLRAVNDDAVRLVDADGTPCVWAYILPRDALHKYADRAGLWCSVTRSTLTFSRPFHAGEAGLEIQVPVMREPRMFRLPVVPTDPLQPLPVIDDDVLEAEVDFAYPDLVIARACYYYAQTDPVMQPRVQTLEGDYKDLMYQLIERDTAITDTPYQNDFDLGIHTGTVTPSFPHQHPHSGYGVARGW